MTSADVAALNVAASSLASIALAWSILGKIRRGDAPISNVRMLMFSVTWFILSVTSYIDIWRSP